MTTLAHIPTVEEVREANKQTRLPESYWWVEGWNFNRSTIVTTRIGVHVGKGPYVSFSFEGETYDADRLQNKGLRFTGPIECPLIKEKHD